MDEDDFFSMMNEAIANSVVDDDAPQKTPPQSTTHSVVGSEPTETVKPSAKPGGFSFDPDKTVTRELKKETVVNATQEPVEPPTDSHTEEASVKQDNVVSIGDLDNVVNEAFDAPTFVETHSETDSDITSEASVDHTVSQSDVIDAGVNIIRQQREQREETLVNTAKKALNSSTQTVDTHHTAATEHSHVVTVDVVERIIRLRDELGKLSDTDVKFVEKSFGLKETSVAQTIAALYNVDDSFKQTVLDIATLLDATPSDMAFDLISRTDDERSRLASYVADVMSVNKPDTNSVSQIMLSKWIVDKMISMDSDTISRIVFMSEFLRIA